MRYAKGLDSRTLTFLASGEFLRKICVRHRLIAAQMLLSLSQCRYLEWGKSWSLLTGEESSQTQYAASDDGVQIWNYPVDVHFATASIQGWPRIVMQLWELDEYGRSILSGYGQQTQVSLLEVLWFAI